MKLASFVHPAAAVLVAPMLVILFETPAQAGMPTHCGGLVPTIVGTFGNDDLVGTDGDDVIVGGHGSDRIRGLGGNDVICGNGNTDRLDGGSGNDRVHGGWGTDTLSGGPGDDVLGGGVGERTVFIADDGDDVSVSWSRDAVFDYSSAPQGVTVDLEAGTAFGWGQDTLRFHPQVAAPRTRGAWYVSVLGSAFDDTLLGGGTSDELAGRDGADTIDGRGSTDYVFADVNPSTNGFHADDDADSVSGGPGDDWVVIGTAGTASGGPGQDSIDIFASHEHAFVPDLAIDGGDGPDQLTFLDEAGDGSAVYRQVTFDMATGSFAADASRFSAVDIENFLVSTTSHTGELTTSFTVRGTDGPNVIAVGGIDEGALSIVTTGTVAIDGAGGDDLILGSRGDDTLIGGPGTDQADAQGGTDTCTSIEDGWYHAPDTHCEVVEP